MIKKYIKELHITPKKLLFIFLGNIAYGLALNLFLAGNGIAAGGFSGLGIVVNYIFPVPIGLFVLCLTIPLLIWSYFVFGMAYVLLTLMSTAMYAVIIDLMAYLPTLIDDRLLAAICGGALNGVAAVLFLKGSASSGGTDLLAKLIMARGRHLSLGKMYMIVDGFVVILSIVVSGDFKLGIYAVIALFACAYVTDLLIAGVNKASVMYVITKNDPQALADEIMYKMGRGVTLLHGTGMFENSDQSIILLVIKPRQVYQVKDIISRCAPDSFTFLTSANEVLGQGFKGLDATKPE